MNILISILANTKTGAAIEIVILLIVAGAIAFITSYLYYKPIYMNRISDLEKENEGLKKHVSSLKSEISTLKTQVDELETEIKKQKDKKKTPKK